MGGLNIYHPPIDDPTTGIMYSSHSRSRSAPWFMVPTNCVDEPRGLPGRSTEADWRGRERHTTTTGLTVAAWAPGKWFGARGKVVSGLLRRFGPGGIALGDTTLRPQGWATPFIMRAARRRGFRVLAGSDPLPFGGEECRPGSYHTVVEADAGPAALAGRLLELPAASLRTGGARGSLLTVARRLKAHKRASHRPET